MNRTYGGVIWTDHALVRMRERNISQGDAWATWRNPDQSRPAQKGGNWVYYKTYPSTGPSTVSSGRSNRSGQAQKIEVVASKNEKGEWVILSVWSRPVFDTGRPAPVNKTWDSLLERLLQRSLGWFRRT